MEPSGAIFNTGSSVGTRAESVQVNNTGSNQYWYTETVYSRNRDEAIYPTPSAYVCPLSRTYKQVLEVELLTAQLPISTYNVESENKQLGTEGENSFNFNEGYIIDDGLFGIMNDRACVREFSNPLMRDSVEPYSTICEAKLPHTLTQLKHVCRYHLPNSQSSVSRTTRVDMSDDEEFLIEVTTETCHQFTTRYCHTIYIMDNSAEYNGKYNVLKITSATKFIARRLPFHTNNQVQEDRIQEDLSSTISSSILSVQTLSTESTHSRLRCKDGGWVYWPRVTSPHILAELVQDYLNQRASPSCRNAYSVTFNDSLGKFVFTRSYGLYLFDLLAGSDDQSVFSNTMGFSKIDYQYVTFPKGAF